MGMNLKAALPYIGMVTAQFAKVVLMMVGKEAMSTGMTNFSFVCYSNSLAALVLLPSSFLIHRSSRPPLTFSILCGIFLLGLVGCTGQLTGYAGIKYTSASFASTLLNLVPGFTFILAIFFRMEKLDCKSSSTLAKSIGTIVSIIGAFVVTLYKGPQILMKTHHQHLLMHHQSDWIIGALFLVVDCVASSAFTIVQALILKNYPAELVIVLFYCFFAAIISAVVSLFVDRDPSAWMLRPSIRLIAVLYGGVFGSAFQVSVVAWCLHRTGPLFVTMYYPLAIVIAVALGIIFLGDTLYLGSLLGSIVIVIGFYSVMWGKSKEVAELTSEKAPLLQINVEETVQQ